MVWLHRRLSYVIAVLIGLLMGVGAAETYHAVRGSQDNVTFQRQVKCKALADDYVKENTVGSIVPMLIQVAYSPARNSCVASVETWIYINDSDVTRYEVLDLLSGEHLYIDAASNSNAQDGLRCMGNEEAAFRHSLKSASAPKIKSGRVVE
jgi:hypothetical protein